MRAAVFVEAGKLELQDVPDPADCAPDEVEIAVEACGICGTDLHILDVPAGHPATPGVVIGHEFVGRVTRAGDRVLAPAVGERVVAESSVVCGMCRPCKSGMPSHCENFTSLGIFRDGGMAERVVVPARLCHTISDALLAAVAALAEPLSCVVNGLQTARPMVADSVAVLGGGAVGQLYAALFRLAGAADVVVVEPASGRRTVATAMGATSAVGPDDLEASWQHGFDIVVDAVGSQLQPALDLTRSGGQTLLFGLNSTTTNSIQQYEITRRELVVSGVYVGSHVFPRAVRILERSGVDFTPMISTYPLSEIHQAVANLRGGGDVKTVLTLG